MKSEDRTYAGLANCAPNAERASSGARNLKDVPDFPSSHIWLQKVNLQVFSRIGKTMKGNINSKYNREYTGVKTDLSTHGLGDI